MTIANALKYMKEKKATGLMTVEKISDSHPHTAINLLEDGWEWSFKEIEPSLRFPRQNRPTMYNPSGGLYIRSFIQCMNYDGKGWSLGDNSYCYPIEKIEALDVNNDFDLKICQFMLNNSDEIDI
jgi:CMP-N-acetylneuraminic acid synthetase